MSIYDTSPELYEEQADEEESSYSTQMLVIHACLAFTIIIGIAGNLVNLVVLSRASMRVFSTFRYLLHLAALDLCVLLVCATDAYANFAHHFEIRQTSAFACRTHTFITYFLSHSASVVLTAVSIDRALVITNKKSATVLCCYCLSNWFGLRRIENNIKTNEKEESVNNLNDHEQSAAEARAKPRLSVFVNVGQRRHIGLHRVDAVVATILCLVGLLNFHYLLFLNLNVEEIIFNHNTTNTTTSSITICFPVLASTYHTFLVLVWPWVDLIVFSLVPSVTMSVCSVFILMAMRQSSAKMKASLKFSKKTAKSERQGRNKRLRRNRQVLIMLVLTNAYFLFSSLPYFIAYAFEYQKKEDEEWESSRGVARAQSLVYLLLYSNNAVNFLFYGLSSEKYRHELAKIFAPWSNVMNKTTRRSGGIKMPETAL